MIKILINAGHGEGKAHNRGSVCSNEGDNNFNYSLVLKDELETYEGVQIDLVRKNIKDNPSLAQRSAMGQGYDLYYSVHSNAVDGKPNIRGTEFWDSVEKPNKELAKALCDATVKLFGHSNRGVRYKEGQPNFNWFGELRFNKAKSAMIAEHGFHTNTLDCNYFKSNHRILAETQAKVIADHYKLIKKSTTNTSKLYKVQVEAYSNKAYAEALVRELKDKGYTPIIVESDNPSNVPIKRERTGRYIENGLEIIEHPPEDWYTAFMQGKNLKQLGVNGVNWAFQNNSEAHLTRAIWSLLANKNGAIGENSYQNGINGIKRGTMIYYQDGTLDIVRIDNLKEITKPIVWAIGGGSLIPNIIPEEKFASDIYRKTIHTGAGYRGDRVLAFVSLDNCTMEEFRQKVLKLELDAGIFGDGGLSSQQNYKGEGRFSSRGLASGFLVKGVK